MFRSERLLLLTKIGTAMLRCLSAVGVIEQQRRLCPQPGLPAPAALQQHQTGDPGGVVLHHPQPLGLQPETAGRLHQLRQPLCGNPTQ